MKLNLDSLPPRSSLDTSLSLWQRLGTFDGSRGRVVRNDIARSVMVFVPLLILLALVLPKSDRFTVSQAIDFGIIYSVLAAIVISPIGYRRSRRNGARRLRYQAILSPLSAVGFIVVAYSLGKIHGLSSPDQSLTLLHGLCSGVAGFLVFDRLYTTDKSPSNVVFPNYTKRIGPLRIAQASLPDDAAAAYDTPII